MTRTGARAVTVDLRDAELTAEVRVLLVGKRLERSRVCDPPLGHERVVDRELRHQRLAGSRRRRHDHRGPFEDGEDCLDLKVIEGKGVAARERPEQIDSVLGDAAGVEGCLDRSGGLVGQRAEAPLLGALYTEA